ncbi:hypothetical protein Acsp03_25880 [Actinomadura sp. NBRC 104412]|nr:hypothetical protein Acsp03_25880 [Actinomadura sp. NBRC 104412]
MFWECRGVPVEIAVADMGERRSLGQGRKVNVRVDAVSLKSYGRLLCQVLIACAPLTAPCPRPDGVRPAEARVSGVAGDHDEVAAGVVEYRGGQRAHLGGLLGEAHAESA